MDSKNDPIIWELLKDSKFRVTDSGTIEKRIYKKQTETTGKELWVPAGWVDAKGNHLINYKGKKLKVNRIVYAKAHGYLRQSLMVINADGDRSNNHPDNLELVSVGEVHRKVYMAGKRKATARLTWNESQEIKKLWRSKEYTQKKLAEKYNVAPSTVSALIRGETYKEDYCHEVSNEKAD
jgi:hypothetical protein